MNRAIIARKYATALMNYYSLYEKDIIWIERCLLVAEFLHRYRRRLLYMPFSGYQTIFEQFGLGDMRVDVIINLLEQRQRVGLLPIVLQAMVALYKEHHGVEHCVIASAAELSDEQKQVIKRFLEEFTKKKLYFQYKNDTSLIAGIRAQGESFCFEDSIAHKIRVLRRLVT